LKSEWSRNVPKNKDSQAVPVIPIPPEEKIYLVLCASGFDHLERVRSALMFAALAASAEFRTVLYCIQDAVEVMVKGSLQTREILTPGTPSVALRLDEALQQGVEIQCCTQAMANLGVSKEDLIDGVVPAGAMSLVELSTLAAGTLSL
jgi:predicted peroxiredoxin